MSFTKQSIENPQDQRTLIAVRAVRMPVESGIFCPEDEACLRQACVVARSFEKQGKPYDLIVFGVDRDDTEDEIIADARARCLERLGIPKERILQMPATLNKSPTAACAEWFIQEGSYGQLAIVCPLCEANDVYQAYFVQYGLDVDIYPAGVDCGRNAESRAI